MSSKKIGIERERFIVRKSDGMIVPAIAKLLTQAREVGQARGLPEHLFHYELFAGQIEDRTPPCQSLSDLEQALLVNDQVLSEVARLNGLAFNTTEFVKEEMIERLEVNPYDRRHQNIWQNISPARRLAASRVVAVHVHLEVSPSKAVALLNYCREGIIENLIKLGDHSRGQRIKAYQAMAETNGVPPIFTNTKKLLDYIEHSGGEKNVWDLVRYKPSTGTVEFRMFGATENIREIIGYVEACLLLRSKIN